MKEDKNILFEEYKILLEGSDKYFDYLYRKISISIVFFTTTVLFALNEETSYFAKELLFLYIIPIFSYLFGLLYYYDISAIAKQGYNISIMENELKKTYHAFISYVSNNKYYKKGYILSYGTSIAFYIFMPLISIVIGIVQVDMKEHEKLFFHGYQIIEYTILYIIPNLFYIIYIIFGLLIFSEIKKIMLLTKEEIEKTK